MTSELESVIILGVAIAVYAIGFAKAFNKLAMGYKIDHMGIGENEAFWLSLVLATFWFIFVPLSYIQHWWKNKVK